jgi:7,8-dihydroneopterin aldolase/epimerase/oxygenase
VSSRCCIVISGLQLDALIGVHPHERLQSQPLNLSIEIRAAFQEVMSDTLDSTIDYEAVVSRAKALTAETRFLLLETLGDFLARRLMDEFGLLGIRIALEKRGVVEGVAAVGVRIEHGVPAMRLGPDAWA